MFINDGRVVDYTYTCKNENDMDGIIYKAKRFRRSDIKHDFEPGVRDKVVAIKAKSKMKIGDAGAERLIK